MTDFSVKRLMEEGEGGYIGEPYPVRVIYKDGEPVSIDLPDFAQAALDRMLAKAREDALREAAERIDRKIKQVQPEMTRRAQRLAEGKKPGFQYALHRADLDARMSDRDMILALIDGDNP